jgi:hypothetical protein
MFVGLQEVSKERALTSQIYTITVGKKRSEAKFYVETQTQVLQLLSLLCDFDVSPQTSPISKIGKKNDEMTASNVSAKTIPLSADITQQNHQISKSQ